MKLFFVRGNGGYDEEDPIIVLADTLEEAELLFCQGKSRTVIYEDNAPSELGKAGKGYKLKKGVIWRQFNAG